MLPPSSSTAPASPRPMRASSSAGGVVPGKPYTTRWPASWAGVSAAAVEGATATSSAATRPVITARRP